MSEHAILGASSAHRWMACPGSVRLSAGVPPQPSTSYAREGTAAHELAAEVLRSGGAASDRIGECIAVDGDAIEVTAEMADAVQVYVDRCRVASGGGVLSAFVEKKFDLSPLSPPAPMFGTADFIVWDESNGLLRVRDFKYGSGVAVHAEGNVQALFYALGAVVELRVKPHTVRVDIDQPRIREEESTAAYTWDDLVRFRAELFRAAERTLDPVSEVITGDHCRFCPALPVCPAHRDAALAVAQQEFGGEGLPAPGSIEAEEVGFILTKAKSVEAWFAALREYAKNELQEGREIPGWKLVEGRGARVWADERKAVQKYRALFGGIDGVAPRKLASVAQIETKLKRVRKKMPDKEWVRVAGGVVLAPEEDPRPGVQTIEAAEEFAVMGSGDTPEISP